MKDKIIEILNSEKVMVDNFNYAVLDCDFENVAKEIEKLFSSANTINCTCCNGTNIILSNDDRGKYFCQDCGEFFTVINN